MTHKTLKTISLAIALVSVFILPTLLSAQVDAHTEQQTLLQYDRSE